MIVDTTEDRITLRDDVGALHALPPFEEKHYVLSEGTPFPPGYAPSLYGYPSALGGYPAPPDEKYITQIEQNIPEGTVALSEGAKVITAEGKHAGSVERVFTNAEADRAAHLLISKGLLSKERKLIPITWVSIVGENEVHLRVEDGVLEGLSTYPY